MVHEGNKVEVHPKNTADNRCGGKQAGYHCHHFHHFIHPEVYIVDIKVVQVHHHIAVVI